MDQSLATTEIDRLVRLGLDRVVVFSVNPTVRQEGTRRPGSDEMFVFTQCGEADRQKHGRHATYPSQRCPNLCQRRRRRLQVSTPAWLCLTLQCRQVCSGRHAASAGRNGRPRPAASRYPRSAPTGLVTRDCKSKSIIADDQGLLQKVRNAIPGVTAKIAQLRDQLRVEATDETTALEMMKQVCAFQPLR